MSTDAQMIDMGVLRAKLLAAQAGFREMLDEVLDDPRALEDDPALVALGDAIAMLNPRRDPDAVNPSVDKDVVTKAITAAHEALLAGGIQNPVEILIVQSHDAAGRSTGRTLASSGANPQDLLRVCLRNIEANNDRLRARRDFLEHT